ncbi:MAG: MBL fold metallo-hydrolase [Candidatus Daviesbacteria bacterium]|nr:MBL fold metallo-hydrolase [Candidatus Daviesbacteria bacterium]
MDIYWYGQSCFKIKGKTSTVVIDPYDPEFTGFKSPKDLEAELVLVTHEHKDHNFTEIVKGEPLIISGAGEYEKAGVSVVGIKTYHDNKSGAERGANTIYHLIVDGVNIVHLGDLGHNLTEEQSSLIDQTDILMIPVGGTYTIDAEDASKVVSELEPKIVIPMHYNASFQARSDVIASDYKLTEGKAELLGVEPFLKEMGAENLEPAPKLLITKDKLPEETTVVLLSKCN